MSTIILRKSVSQVSKEGGEEICMGQQGSFSRQFYAWELGDNREGEHWSLEETMVDISMTVGNC
jgi:hypothetical protein